MKEFLELIGSVLAFFGWLFFTAFMVVGHFGVIYATNDQSVIDHMQAAWETVEMEEVQQPNVSFKMKIGD